MKSLANLHVKIFADGADCAGMLEMYQNPWIKGFTTNPTLRQLTNLFRLRFLGNGILSSPAEDCSGSRNPHYLDVVVAGAQATKQGMD
jgi:transaldolase